MVKEAVAASRSRQSIVDNIKVESLDRAKADVAKWRAALEEWEGIGTNVPDRYEMMQLYAELIQDDSVATHMTTIVRSIEGTGYGIGSLQSEKFVIDETKTELFQAEWIESIIRAIIEAEMMGHTLVEVRPPDSGADSYTPDNIKIVPREYVIPEWRKVRIRPQVNIDLIDYTMPQFASRLLQIGDRYDKGLFNNIVLIYIYKKNALAYWSNYQSKFGIPPVIVKTDLSNEKKVSSLSNFLQNMRSNTFGLVGFDDAVEILNNVDSDAFQTFQSLIDHCDKQISKVLEGQTMTSSDGSSRSQAEVHERIAEEFHQARLRRVERIINKLLMPIIRQDFPGYENLEFRFSEKKNVDEIIDRVVKLKEAGYGVNQEYLQEVTGMPLEALPEPAPITPPKEKEKDETPASVMKEIEALYASDHDHEGITQ